VLLKGTIAVESFAVLFQNDTESSGRLSAMRFATLQSFSASLEKFKVRIDGQWVLLISVDSATFNVAGVNIAVSGVILRSQNLDVYKSTRGKNIRGEE
jgi:hypothetical protein